VDAVAARIPTRKAGLLTNAGRVLLTKVTLSAIPVHLSIACCLSQWVIQQIDKRRRAFPWAGTDSVSGGKCKVAWPVVCRPTGLGGLGVTDLRFFGLALRLRWEWLARSEPERCWVKLPSKPEKMVGAMCAASLSVVVGDSASTRLWTDSWADVGPLHLFAPALFAATSRVGRARTLVDSRWARDVVGAPTTQVLCEYFKVWDLLAGVSLQPLVPDRFVWKWSPDGAYSVSSTYRAFFHGSTSLLGAKELWSTKAPPRVKLFFWLALHRRLWTSECRMRHGLQDHDICALCDQGSETVAHLFLGCVFARQVWLLLLQPLNLTSLMPERDEDIGPWWLRQCAQMDAADRKLFDSLLLLVAWSLGKERNARVFGRPASSAMTVARSALREGEDWALGGFAPLVA